MQEISPDALCVCMLSRFSRVWLFVTPWTVACQASFSMRFPGQEYSSGLPFPPPGDLPDLGIEPSCVQQEASGFFTSSATWEAPTPPNPHPDASDSLKNRDASFSNPLPLQGKHRVLTLYYQGSPRDANIKKKKFWNNNEESIALKHQGDTSQAHTKLSEVQVSWETIYIEQQRG